MEVNFQKTIRSEKRFHNIEFARNYVIYGLNISPIQYGLVFAWNEGKTSVDSIFWNHPQLIKDHDVLISFIKLFYNNIKLNDIIYIIFFFFKFKESLINIELFTSSLNLPSWIKLIDFDKIIKITRGQKEITSVNFQTSSFMKTFESPLIVRQEKDVLLAIDLASRILLLTYIDDDIAKMANVIHSRLNSVQLINYTTDKFGNSLISNRERNLIDKVIYKLDKTN
jgi:hypothetical protein